MTRVLLDACVPQPMRKHITGYEIVTAGYMKWDRLTNGDLLSAMSAAGFSVLITAIQICSISRICRSMA